MKAKLAGVSRSKILDLLDGKEMAIADMVEPVGISHGNIGRHLAAMEKEGLVQRRHIDGVNFVWSLADSGAQPSAPAAVPPARADGGRVSLAEQLVDVERAIAELMARREEIIRSLA